MPHWLRVVLKQRYWILVSLLAAITAHNIQAGIVQGDFWSHSARVKELIERPFAPVHSVVAEDVPDVEFSPYLLATALVGRTLGLDPFESLYLATFLNLQILAFGLRGWVLENGWREAVAFYFLLFVTLLWGPSVYYWSGFLHLDQIAIALSFPSGFAMALMFSCVAAYQRSLRPDASPGWLGAAILLLSAILISHPVTAVGTGALCGGALIGMRRLEAGRALVGLGVLAGGAALLAGLWPYFSLLDLLLGGAGAAEFHTLNAYLYTDVVWRALPAFVGIPFLVARAVRDPFDPLAWAYGALAGLYLFGWVAGVGLGRMISFMSIVSQLAIACFVAEREPELLARRPLAWATFALLAPLILLRGTIAFDRMERIQRSAAMTPHPRVLIGHVDYRDIVVAEDCQPVPSFGGRTIDFGAMNVYFIDDWQDRRDGIIRFYRDDTEEAWRRAFIAEHRARFVLVEQSETPATRTALVDLGNVIAEDDLFLLVGVDRRPAD